MKTTRHIPDTIKQDPRLHGDDSFYTKSTLMNDIFKKVQSIARLDKHVILIGEIGVGKKRIAHTIHNYSNRANGPFHTFYCIDIDEAEIKEAFWEHVHIENEHLQLKYDVLEKASNGTLYIDQFSELSSTFMLKLINSYIQGCHQLFRYNTATSPRLIISIRQEAFQWLQKTDVWVQLLKSLDPISLMMPPLRERKEDIPILINRFLEEARTSDPSWDNLNIAPAAIKECLLYNWPGNMRQLKNAILQGAVLSHGSRIECPHLPFSMSWKLPYRT